MIAITGQLPLSNIIGPAFLLLTILFVVTTGDSMAYSISMAVTGDGDPELVCEFLVAYYGRSCGNSFIYG